MQSHIPLTRDLVMIGGGHAHALALRMWGMDPVPGVRVTLINPGPTAPYSGMLPGHIAGHYRRDELDIDLVRLARFAGARLVIGAACDVDPLARRVTLTNGRAIDYDVASLDIGLQAAMPALSGFSENGVPVKPLDAFASRWSRFVEQVAGGVALPDVAVIGAGVAGCEVSLAMAHRLRGFGAAAQVSLIEAGPDITGVVPRAKAALRHAMADLGVELLTGAHVVHVEPDAVVLADGRRIPAAFCAGAAGGFAHPWVAETALPVDEAGFVPVNAQLQVEGQQDLFAVGDCAAFVPDPRPKAGVYAVRAAPVLLHNLRVRLAGGTLRAFRPQKDFLKLISLGEQSAIAQRGALVASGPALWRWKNRIDQKFMDKFRQMPRMKAAPLPKTTALGVAEEFSGQGDMMCAGCGSKVAPGVLSGTLASLPRVERSDVIAGPGDDAAILEMGGVRQVLTTDHLRAFTEDAGLFARIAAIHALGDIWAMGAAPQSGLVSVTLPRQSEPLQARAMAEIMGAIHEVLADEGAEIVGGHSTQGAEAVIGLTLTGVLDGPAVTVAGAKPGDALVLTRPLGTGTLLAGEMRGLARGADVADMLAAMAQSQGAVARALAPLAHAMTDVTGFGLAGHMAAICRASGVGARLNLTAIPTYAGTLDLARAGVRSTIYGSNLAAAPVAGLERAEAGVATLLHDPQTAGGFLAAVPDGRSACDAVRAAGGQAWVIGEVVTGSGLALA